MSVERFSELGRGRACQWNAYEILNLMQIYTESQVWGKAAQLLDNNAVIPLTTSLCLHLNWLKDTDTYIDKDTIRDARHASQVLRASNLLNWKVKLQLIFI